MNAYEFAHAAVAMSYLPGSPDDKASTEKSAMMMENMVRRMEDPNAPARKRY